MPVILRAELKDEQATQGLQRITGAIQQMERSHGDASRGLRRVQDGLRTLAFEAAGVPGPIGKIVAGMLQLGAGSTIVLAAAAGLGALALAYRELTRDTRETAKAQEDMVRGLSQLGPNARIVQERIRLAGLQRVATELEARKGLTQAFGAQVPGGQLLFAWTGTEERRLQEALQAVATQTIALAKAEKDAADAAERQADAHARALPSLAEELRLIKEAMNAPLEQAAARARGLIPGGPSVVGITGVPGIRQPTLEVVTQDMKGVLEDALPSQGQLNQAIREGIPGARELARAITQTGIAAERAAGAQQLLALSYISAISGVMAALIGGGSPGSILAGVGGLVGLVNPIAGAVIGGVGAIVSAADQGVTVDRYGPEALRQLQGIPTGPTRVELLLVTPAGQQIDRLIYEIGRRERRDAVSRLPVVVGGG